MVGPLLTPVKGWVENLLFLFLLFCRWFFGQWYPHFQNSSFLCLWSPRGRRRQCKGHSLDTPFPLSFRQWAAVPSSRTQCLCASSNCSYMTSMYRSVRNQVGRILGFLVGFTTSEKARDAWRAFVERLLMISACVTSTWERGVASAGQLVSGLMDSKPQMPLVLSRTQSLLW